MYDVRLGSIDLYGVLSVDIAKSRNITIYDSVGAGKFPVAKNKDLNAYSIEMELSEFKQYKHSEFTKAKSIFKELDKLIESDRAVRLIVRSDYKKLSQLVLLKDYTAKEIYAGVYEVTLKCLEYVDVDIRTTNIPHIKRQGKIPNPPPQAIVGNPAEFTKKVAGASHITPVDDEWTIATDRLKFLRDDNSIYHGLSNIPNDKAVNVKWAAGVDSEWNTTYKNGMEVSGWNEDSALIKGAKKAFDGISNFWKGYFDKDREPIPQVKNWKDK